MKLSAERKRRSSQAGMTLVEVILAVSLFGFITVSSGLVLRVAFRSMNAIDSKVDLDRRVVGSQRALDQMLRGIMAINARCGALPIGFQGSPSAVRFVSSYSMSQGSRGRPQIVELIAEAKSDGSGYRLVVNEYPYLGKVSLSQVCGSPVSVRPTSFILVDQLAECRFLYKWEEQGSGAEMWMPNWITPEWPRAIRIEMQPRNRDLNRVQAATTSIPIIVRNKQFEQ